MGLEMTVCERAAVWTCAVALGVLVVNVVANCLSPINDLLNLAPLLPRRLRRLLTFRSCGAFVLLLAVAICPWWTFSSESTFILTFLNGCARAAPARSMISMIGMIIKIM